ncbi:MULTISPECIES: sigma-70 family RNA polymerase sigma factor [Bacillus cereus group]|uniref:Sigma-70 family RNA polymerase sigma factor n=1 Tax=Bacillus thuringiensis TaxID=1428 RepID=A0A1C4CW69_BACTU|nr:MULTISPECIES: sigma-70 family RNA polymerase sigma factor [Bacillus cereus group]MCC2325999.1 sigma-70 family RNA polymerase sigma factor [Bacillus wiedmannii]MCU5680510.1 sigma-70 family RNA polymerase sigma factor [Bacillus wiedmannii]MDP1458098.1 sigma-70 family RNA polymerase sigma factor [Bacillus wiedmannii]MED2014932.1 sigma-70 family RNA polymerase sigma factor [Bacillus wiedmannii]MED3022870.1 sigma-70 family RNA polymerase sigma factor [Bacillus wiedmannii]
MKVETVYTDLIQLTLSGNKEAYSKLYDKTIQEVYKTAHFLVEDKTDVDDVVQEIYIQLYESLRKYDSKKPFRPWLIGLAIKQIHSYRRKRWMRLRIIKKAEEQRKPEQIDFSNDVVRKISNKKLIELIHKLPYKLKQVIILRYLHDYSQEEVAQILHIPIGTVKSRIHAALKKLRQIEQVEEIFLGEVGNVK